MEDSMDLLRRKKSRTGKKHLVMDGTRAPEQTREPLTYPYPQWLNAGCTEGEGYAEGEGLDSYL